MATRGSTDAPRRGATEGGRQLWSHPVVIVLVCLSVLALYSYNVHRHYFIGDDSFISFRYAQHLAQGEGLVWNPGERVEGYTNFLWVLLMAGAIAVGAAPEVVSNAIGILSGAMLLLLLSLLPVNPLQRWSPASWIAPLALAGNRSFTAWCTGGLETMFFSTLVFLACVSFLREQAHHAKRPLASSALFAVATLARPEGALFMLLAGLFYLGATLARRRPLRPMLIWSLPYLIPVCAHLLWRQAYYGFWLPNSFRAKVPGAWWDQGLEYLALFARDYRIVWVLPLALLGVVLRRQRVSYFFTAVLASYVLYVAYIGGDRFEFRFMVVVLPYLYWLAADGARQLAVQGRGGSTRRLFARGVAAAWVVVLLATSITGSRTPEARKLRQNIASLENIGHYASGRVEEGRFLRSLVDEGLLPPNLMLCAGGVGAVSYHTRWPTLDRRGLNDVRIAAMPLERRGVVAHERDAPFDYLVERRVVIFDVFNRIVHTRDILKGRPLLFPHDGHSLPLRAVRAEDRYLVFATTLADQEFRRVFSHLEIVH
jgi:hypothetical protein